MRNNVLLKTNKNRLMLPLAICGRDWHMCPSFKKTIQIVFITYLKPHLFHGASFTILIKHFLLSLNYCTVSISATISPSYMILFIEIRTDLGGHIKNEKH